MNVGNLQWICRWQLYFGILLILQIPMKVDSEFCPNDCHCHNMDGKKSYKYASCVFGNSQMQIMSFPQKLHLDSSIISRIFCNGTNYPTTCEKLPQLDTTITKNAVIRITSCSLPVLECLDYMHPGVADISLLKIRNINMIDVHNYTVGGLMIETPVRELQVITTDIAEDIPIGILNQFKRVESFEFVGGHVNISNFTIIQNIAVNLVNLNFSNNNISSLVFNQFYFTNLKTLNITNSSMEHITAKTFSGLDILQRLTLKDNKNLKYIEAEAVSKLKYLQHLHIEYNSLESLQNGMFNGLLRLREVIIKNNLKVISLDFRLFSMTSIEFLEMTRSKINILPENIFEESQDLKHLNLSNNMIETLPAKLFTTNKLLEIIILKSNKINMLPRGIFGQSTSLQQIDLRDNYIIELQSYSFSYNELPMHVWLDRNRLTVLDLDVFQDSKLTHLSVTSNQIQRIVSNSLTSLKIENFDLNNNEISTFETWWLNIYTLKMLNLSHNNINTINESYIYQVEVINDDDFYFIPDNNTHIRFIEEVMEIDLRHNNIFNTIIDKSISKYIYEHKSYKRLYISNNSLNCDCISFTLLRNMHLEGIIADYENIICDNIKEHISNLRLDTMCNKKYILMNTIGTSAVASLLILILVLSIFAHRNRIWKYMKTIFNHKTTNDLTPQQKSLDELKKFDLFISFAHEDVEFVMDILLPKLEMEFGQSVCVHYRDWIAGQLIVDQIIQSVESSRKTIIILTEYFLSSEWSQLEFQTAYNWSKQEGTSNIIVIILDEAVVRDPNLPDDMKSYIDNYSYLLCDVDDPISWVKLKKILPRQGKKSKKIHVIK